MKSICTAVALLALGGMLSGQTPQSKPVSEEPSKAAVAAFPASLAGEWKSSPFEVELTSDLHRSVYGPDARSVRLVTLMLRRSGDGTFSVVTSVRDRHGKTVPGTRQIEELTFKVGDLQQAPGQQPRYASHVEHAERRYPDPPASVFPLDGAKLALYVPEGKEGTIQVRFDTPEGQGSFWETLRRGATATTSRHTGSS